MAFVEPLGSAFAPVKQRRAFEDIIVQVENAILEGRLRVGDRLPPERELAEIFNVSRASVREALRVLEAFGVLSARRGTGAESGSIVSAQNGSPLSGLLRLVPPSRALFRGIVTRVAAGRAAFAVRTVGWGSRARDTYRSGRSPTSSGGYDYEGSAREVDEHEHELPSPRRNGDS